MYSIGYTQRTNMNQNKICLSICNMVQGMEYVGGQRKRIIVVQFIQWTQGNYMNIIKHLASEN
jgi:hypothetical protein